MENRPSLYNAKKERLVPESDSDLSSARNSKTKHQRRWTEIDDEFQHVSPRNAKGNDLNKRSAQTVNTDFADEPPPPSPTKEKNNSYGNVTSLKFAEYARNYEYLRHHALMSHQVSRTNIQLSFTAVIVLLSFLPILNIPYILYKGQAGFKKLYRNIHRDLPKRWGGDFLNLISPRATTMVAGQPEVFSERSVVRQKKYIVQDFAGFTLLSVIFQFVLGIVTYDPYFPWFLDARNRIRICHRLLVCLVHQFFVLLLFMYPNFWKTGYTQISVMEKYGPLIFYSSFVFFGSLWIFYDPKMAPPNPEVLKMHTIRKYRSNLRQAHKSVLNLSDMPPNVIIAPEEVERVTYVDQNLAEYAEDIQAEVEMQSSKQYWKSLKDINKSLLFGGLWGLLPFIFRIQCDGSFFYYIDSAGGIILIILVFCLNAMFFAQFMNLVQAFVSMVHKQYLMVKTTSDVLVKFNHSKSVVKKYYLDFIHEENIMGWVLFRNYVSSTGKFLNAKIEIIFIMFVLTTTLFTIVFTLQVISHSGPLGLGWDGKHHSIYNPVLLAVGMISIIMWWNFANLVVIGKLFAKQQNRQESHIMRQNFFLDMVETKFLEAKDKKLEEERISRQTTPMHSRKASDISIQIPNGFEEFEKRNSNGKSELPREFEETHLLQEVWRQEFTSFKKNLRIQRKKVKVDEVMKMIRAQPIVPRFFGIPLDTLWLLLTPIVVSIGTALSRLLLVGNDQY